MISILLVARMPALAQAGLAEASLRLGGKEVPLSPALAERLAGLARDVMQRCGPNTVQHPQHFDRSELDSVARWREVLAGSRLHVVYAAAFESRSHLGDALPVSEVLIGLEDKDLFVGPDFTRHRGAVAEHVQCEYLASLELACLPELARHLSPRYRETCARLERDAAGHILMPPEELAPACGLPRDGRRSPLGHVRPRVGADEAVAIRHLHPGQRARVDHFALRDDVRLPEDIGDDGVDLAVAQ
jgi:hypothetical protein